MGDDRQRHRSFQIRHDDWIRQPDQVHRPHRGFTYSATTGLGEQAVNANDGRKYAIGGSWFGDGLGFMVTWEQINGNSIAATGLRDQTRAFHVGVAYNTGHWRTVAAMLGYRLELGKPATAHLRGDTYWAGVSYLVGNVTLTGAVYHINTKNLPTDRDADPTLTIVRAMYTLSKRTTLYAVAARAKANHGRPIGLSRDELGEASTHTGITTGIQYRF
jgi:predicted porin